MDRGKYIKEKISEYGYTIDMIALMLELNPSTVFRWVKTKDLSLVRMKQIADVLKLDLREDFPESKTLYYPSPKNYEVLYFKELERNRMLQEEMEQYKAKQPLLPGQNRD